jgi:hypothetical protein
MDDFPTNKKLKKLTQTRIKRVYYNLLHVWFKSLWQTFEALVAKKMCTVGKCIVL